MNKRFDSLILKVTGGTIDMGVLERVKRIEREEALQKGLEKGRLEERARAEAAQRAKDIESARKFKEMGIPVEDIAKGLGLSIEEVEKL